MYNIFLSRRSIISTLAAVSAVVGGVLLAASAMGLIIPLRAPDVSGYRDFAGSETLDFETAISRLDSLAEGYSATDELVTSATRIFHEGIAHIARKDVNANGLAHYGMRVPFTENWILFVLSALKPDSYRDYEFCSFRRALERGTGRCGQQSMALVSFLSELGVETGFVTLEGHVVATAKVDSGDWYLLDSDYGGVIPFDIDTAERNPDSVLPYYWNSAASENRLNDLYATENRVKYGGPSARYARACPVEYAAYILKWVVPGLLFVPWSILRTSRRRGVARQR